MPQLTACALPGCSNPIIPGRIPFTLGGHPGEYCSRGCVNIAFELMRKQKKFAKAQPEKVDYARRDEREEAAARASPAAKEDGVKVKAEEFGGAGVYRHYCDNPACEGPITVSWKGRRGEYCSNDCLKTEKEKDRQMTTEETTETSPIAAGAPAAKKAKGKSAKKAAPTAKKSAVKKTAAPAAKKAASAASGDRVTYAKDGVIKVLKKAELAAHGRRGQSGDAFDALKDGITVEKYREAVHKKNANKANASWYAGNTIKFAVAEGWIAVK